MWGFRGCCAEVPRLPRLVPGRSRAFLWLVLTRRAYSCIGSRVIRGQCWASCKFEKLWTFEEICENIWKVMNSLSLRVDSENFSRSSIKNHAQNWSRLLKWASKVKENLYKFGRYRGRQNDDFYVRFQGLLCWGSWASPARSRPFPGILVSSIDS